uniref:Uncharacterized protein n=1 Tax=Glossina morsitans morsitans TaxID=37546 RepID=A0A1B0FB83_GLOMM
MFTFMRLFILCAFGQTLIFADEPSSSFNRFNLSGYNDDYENNHRNIYINKSPQNGYYPRAYDNYNNPTYLTDLKSFNNYYPENSFTNENYQQNYNYVPSTELEPPKRNYFAFTTGWSSRRSNSYLPPRQVSSDSSSSKQTLQSNYYSSPQVISGAYLSSNPNRQTSYTESNYPHFFTTTSSANTKPDDLSRSTVTARPLYLKSSTTKFNEYASYPSVELFKPVPVTATPPTKIELADSYAPPILRNLRILDQNRQYLPPSTPRSVYSLSTSTASINIPLPLYSAPLSNQRKDTETFRDDGYHYDAPSKIFES